MSGWKRSEEHTSELQSPCNLVCRLLLEKKKQTSNKPVATRTSNTASSGELTVVVVSRHRGVACRAVSCVSCCSVVVVFFFFFNDTATTEIYPLSLHALFRSMLKAMLAQFPFHIRGFHSDNGSEYINHMVAELLNKLLIEQTKSRPRH